MVEESVPANGKAVPTKRRTQTKSSEKNKQAISPTGLIEHVEVTVEAILGDCKIKVSELTGLNAGELLPLDRQINEAVDMRVNGKTIGRGEIVTVEGKFAVRITEMG